MIKLSIGIPNYNHAEFLPAALDSILQQSWQDFELILIDDASTDNSLEILRDYARRYPAIRLIENKQNQGVIPNVLTLLTLARGEFYYAAAADDILLPGFFEKTISLLERYPSAGLCSALCYSIDKEGNNRRLLFPDPFGYRKPEYYFSPEEMRQHFEKRTPWIQGNTVIYRKAALIGVGGYRPELGSFCDGFVQHVIALSHGACFIPEPLAAWRRMPDTFSVRTNLNPAASRKIRDHVRGYMTTEFKAIFPTAYVRRWTKRWDSGFLIAFTKAKSLEWRQGLQQVLSPESLSTRILLSMADLAAGAALMFTLLAAVALRWFDLRDMIRNRLNQQRSRQ
ncbi:MAG: Chondroitin synthase [Verrucomicrobiota bacterium]|jgi:glycosyltransferase involved in cell wall biosynthesis